MCVSSFDCSMYSAHACVYSNYILNYVKYSYVYACGLPIPQRLVGNHMEIILR